MVIMCRIYSVFGGVTRKQSENALDMAFATASFIFMHFTADGRGIRVERKSGFVGDGAKPNSLFSHKTLARKVDSLMKTSIKHIHIKRKVRLHEHRNFAILHNQ